MKISYGENDRVTIDPQSRTITIEQVVTRWTMETRLPMAYTNASSITNAVKPKLKHRKKRSQNEQSRKKKK